MKKISTTLAIGIITVLMIAVVVGILVYRHYLMPQRSSVPIVAKISPTITPTIIPTSKDKAANWKTYQNNEYGFRFDYPVNWIVSTPTQLGVAYFMVRIETVLSDGSTAKFDVWIHQTQIAVLTYQKYKGTFEGQEAYLHDFNLCANENDSTVACVTKVIEVLIGSSNRFTFAGTNYLESDVVEIDYGVYRNFSADELRSKSKGITDFSSENVNQILGLYDSYRGAEPALKQILSTFKFIK